MVVVAYEILVTTLELVVVLVYQIQLQRQHQTSRTIVVYQRQEYELNLQDYDDQRRVVGVLHLSVEGAAQVPHQPK